MGAASAAGTLLPLLARAQGSGPIKVGAFGPMSGNAAAQGQSLRQGVEMAAKAKNASGGLLGRPIELVIGDDAGKPEEAGVIARRFATRDTVCIALGSVSSPASLAAAQVFREEQVPQIVVSGTAQRITTQGNEWVFRCTIPDRKFVADLVDFINDKFPRLKRFGFIYVNDDFGKGGFDSFVEAGKKYGISVAAGESYTRGDVDFTAQLTKMRAANVEAIVDWSRYTGGCAHPTPASPAQHGGPAALRLRRYRAAARSSSSRAKRPTACMYATDFSPATSADNPVAVKWIEAFRKEFGQASGLCARAGLRRDERRHPGDRAREKHRSHGDPRRPAQDRLSERARTLQVRCQRRSDARVARRAHRQHERDQCASDDAVNPEEKGARR